MRAKITKRSADAARDKAAIVGTAVVLFDTEQPGFVLKASPRGSRSYQFRYRMGGRATPLRTYTIARHGEMTPEQARRQAQALLGDVRRGIDPGVEKLKRVAEARGALTLAQAAADFMDIHVRAKRKLSTVVEYERLLRMLILPSLGARRFGEILSGDIERWHHGLRSTPYQANRALAVLSMLMSWGGSRGHRHGDNPCRPVERFKELPRKRYLSPAEITRVGEAIRDLENSGDLSLHVAALFRILLLTGLRKDEVRLLEWRRVDLIRAVIVLEDRDAKGGARDVPLSAPVMQVLSNLPRNQGNDFVFVGKRVGRPVVNVSKPWARVLGAAGIDRARIHDLRHTAASVGVAAGVSLTLIGGVLGHKSHQTTARYAHLSDDPVRASSEMIAERIAKALDGESPELRRPKRS